MVHQQLIDKKIVPFLRKEIPRKRLGHIFGVAVMSEKLARKHGCDPVRARMAGVLHDIARCWEYQELVRYVFRNELKVPYRDYTAKHQPVLLHSYVGADLAKKVFGVKDREILSAVRKHSLGSVKMSGFEKCIYMADLAAPDRKFSGVSVLRDLAFKDIDRAFVEGIRTKVLFLVRNQEPVHPESIRVWNHWVMKRGSK